MLAIPLSYTDLFYITHDGEAVIEITPLSNIDDGITGSLVSSLHDVWMGYNDIDPQDPSDLIGDLIE